MLFYGPEQKKQIFAASLQLRNEIGESLISHRSAKSCDWRYGERKNLLGRILLFLPHAKII